MAQQSHSLAGTAVVAGTKSHGPPEASAQLPIICDRDPADATMHRLASVSGTPFPLRVACPIALGPAAMARCGFTLARTQAGDTMSA